MGKSKEKSHSAQAAEGLQGQESQPSSKGYKLLARIVILPEGKIDLSKKSDAELRKLAKDPSFHWVHEVL